jgi:hypothetical protein
MKKLITFYVVLFIATNLWAQSPEKMSYQAVVRDANNMLVASTLVGTQISVLQGSVDGTPVYIETHTPETNVNGLLSLEIGVGTSISGDFTNIDWANGPYFIKSETDPTGGTNYTIIGVSQLLSVPYALYAATAGNNIPGPEGEQGPPGADGQDGLSAYEVWLSLGNTGTEADFLDSLVGPEGPQGEQGNNFIGFKTINTIFNQNFNIAPGSTINGSVQNINKANLIINFFPSYNQYHNISLTVTCYDINNNILELYVEELNYRRDVYNSLRVDFTKVETSYYNTSNFDRNYSSVTGQNGTSGEAKGDIKIWANGIVEYIQYSINNTNLNPNFPSTRQPNLIIYTLD